MGKSMKHRSGRYALQPGKYRAFIPKPLPPSPSLKISADTQKLLGDAGIALGRLDGLTVNLPNTNLFLSMYVRKEALLSSQIEGTQASLDDVLAFEAEETEKGSTDAGEVVNYIRAMRWGLKKLKKLPLCNRLMKDIHKLLLDGTRGDSKTPGEFREIQNWIGPPGCSVFDASFVPPPPRAMREALDNLENFINRDRSFHSLIRCALVHGQFETIHPFLDGNGRIGRLLITFMLCAGKILQEPLLYLSYYFKANRQEYYDTLNNIRHEGNWEAWVNFFLKGVIEVSNQAINTARDILNLRSEHEMLVLQSRPRGATNALSLLDAIYERPYISAKGICQTLEVSHVTANSLLTAFSQLGLLREVTGMKWRQIYSYEPYLRLLREGTQPDIADVKTAR